LLGGIADAIKDLEACGKGGDNIFATGAQFLAHGQCGCRQDGPRVNAGGLVSMTIEQEASLVSDALTTEGIESPTFRQRRITSTVAVQSGETVVLGGLIQDSRDRSESGVPFLRSIPGLGLLFSCG